MSSDSTDFYFLQLLLDRLQWLNAAAAVQDGAVLGGCALPGQRIGVTWPVACLRSHPEIFVLLRISERVHRILTLLNQTNVFFQHLSELDDADVGVTEMLPGTI